MFDQVGMWEMNKAHHQDLLAVASKRRLLAQARNRAPMLLERVRNILGMPWIFASRRSQLAERGVIR